MRLTDIKIENFRGIRSLRVDFDTLTVLIGENNIGKSTVLEAIRLVLTRGGGSRREFRFSEYDFHLPNADSTPQTASPISITLHFAEQHEDEWSDAITQQLSEVIQLGTDGRNHIWFQATGFFQTESGSFETKSEFLNNNGEYLTFKNKNTSLNLLTRLVPLFFLSALRDASQEFGQRGQFWGGFLKSIQLPDDRRKQIEEMLREVNTSVIGANEGLTEVVKKIADAGRFVSLPSTEPVVLEAVPTRVFDMVGKIHVHLKSHCDSKIPLNRHGEGTQSLAVLMLFKAFVSVNLKDVYLPESTPLLVLEEPEAHLHPSAVRSLGTFLGEPMEGQIIVASHSGNLISHIPITSLRRLYLENGETKVGQVQKDLFEDWELQAIDYDIRLTKGHYLFSRCWLLVEGKTEFYLMPLLLEIMGFSQDQVSISVVEISQAKGKGEPFLKLANALGIPWIHMADGDVAGQEYGDRAKKHLAVDISNRTRILPHKNIELELWHNGYEKFIESFVPDSRKKQITVESAEDSDKRIEKIIKSAVKQVGGKPSFALKLADEIKRRGKDTIPQSLKSIITDMVQLTKE